MNDLNFHVSNMKEAEKELDKAIHQIEIMVELGYVAINPLYIILTPFIWMLACAVRGFLRFCIKHAEDIQ